jgi:hypothetical protein
VENKIHSSFSQTLGVMHVAGMEDCCGIFHFY